VSLVDLINSVRNREIRAAVVAGETYYVRELSAAQVGILSDAPRHQFAAKAIGMALCEEDGTDIEVSEHQIDALSSGSSRMLGPIYDAVAGISGLEKDAVEESAKNSTATD